MSITIEELTNTIKNAVSLGSLNKFNSDTSTFQTQIDNKIATITDGGLTSVLTNNLTPSKILVSDNDGKLSTSTIDSSKLFFLKDITSNIQAQLNSKQSTFNGSINSILNSNFVPGKAIISNNTGELESSTLDSTQLDFLSNISTDLQTNLDLLITSSNNLNTLCINSNNEIKKWNYPSNIISITSLSSLPSTFIFVKDKICRVRLTMDNDLYTNNISDLISEIIITSGNATESAINLNLESSGIVIDINNSTIDFDYQATSQVQHDISIKLKSPNILDLGVTIHTYNISVLQSNIFSFPSTLTSTTKNSPYDISDITVGETIVMTSTFSETLNSNIIANIVINDTYSNLSIISSNISGSDVIYSFTIANDADHSGIITLNFGGKSQSYNWTTGLLTANSHIYQFPNYFSVTGTIQGLVSNPIILTFSGGDSFHSSIIDSQIEYIKWNQGSGDQTISSSNLTIDTANNTITINSFTPTEWTIDLTFKIKLRGPENTLSNPVLSSEITCIVPANNILTGVTWYVHEPGYYYEVQPNNIGVRPTFMDASNTTRAMTIFCWIHIPPDSKHYRLTTETTTSWTLMGLTSDIFGYTGGTNPPSQYGLPFITGVETSVWNGQHTFNAENRRFVNMFSASNWDYNQGRNAFSVNSTYITSPWNSVPYGMGMGSGYYYTSQQYNDWRADIYNRGNAPALAFNDWAFVGFKVGSDGRFVQFIGDKNNPVLEGAWSPSNWHYFTHDGNLGGAAASNEIGHILNFPPQHWSYSSYATTAKLHIEDLIVIHDELTLTELDNIRLNGISSDAPGVVAHWFKRGSLNDASPTGSNLLKKQSRNKSGNLVTLPS